MTNPIESAGNLLREGARFLADLVDCLVGRIVNGIKGIAPLAIGLGCQSTSVEDVAVAVAPAPKIVAPPTADAATKPAEPQPLGAFSITFYYVVGEEEVSPRPAVANDNQSLDEDDTELAAVAAPEKVAIYAFDRKKTCTPIAEVSREFATQLRIQGTGKLRDGRIVNVWSPCPCERSPCFKVTRARWGTAGNGRQLRPFRTVAVDPRIVKLGSLLHIPLLEGRLMPGRPPWGGFVHDGCVVADDVGGGIKGNQLDLFVGRRGWFRSFGRSGRPGRRAWAVGVPVYDGSKLCERKGRRVGRKTGAI